MNTTNRSRRPFTPTEDEFLKANYPTMGLKRTSEALRRNEGSVGKRAALFNLITVGRTPLSPDQIDIIKTFYPTEGEAGCRRRTGRSGWSIRCAVGRLGIRGQMAIARRESRIDLTRFTTVREPVIAYYLGLLWADGHVAKANASICLYLQMADYLDIKESLTAVISHGHYARPARPRVNPSGGVQVTHHGLHAFLVAHDYLIKSIASPSKILSTIPDHLKHYWWRGYFDGDGHIGHHSIGRYWVSLAGSHTQDWHDAESWLKVMGVRYVLTRVERLNKRSGQWNRHSVIKVTNRAGFVAVGEYLYRGYDQDRIGLTRKRRAYLDGLATMERQRVKLQARSVRMAVYTEDWRPLGEYPSIQAAAKAVGTTSKDIGEYFRCRRTHHKHMQFRRLTSPPRAILVDTDPVSV